MCYHVRIDYKINNLIKAVELRVIGEDGENLGVMPTSKALQLSMDRGLDLIEIAAAANPPVAKIMSFDKFRYQQNKEDKQKRVAQKVKELKHIQLTPRIAEGDKQMKMKRLVGFLEEGHKVEISISLRGREKGNKDWGLMKMNEFIASIPVPHMVTMPPKAGGRGFVAQVAKK